MKTQKKSKAFTLVELLIVIAIIGVLAALVLPNLSGVLGQGNKTKAMNNARNIAQAWAASPVSGGASVHIWAAKLAKKEKGMNTAAVWILEFDSAVQEKVDEGLSLPLAVADNKGKVLADFKQFPLSFAVAKSVKTGGSSIPLLWTRGLTPKGEWDESKSVFPDGGYIAFADGSAKWYNKLTDDNGKGMLQKYGEPGVVTSNIAQAIAKSGSWSNVLESKVVSVEDEAPAAPAATEAPATPATAE